MTYSASARSALWATLLGGLTTLVAGPITFHLVGPLVLLVVHHPTGSTWDPIIGGLSLAIAGALVVFVLGRVVQLPPRLAAAGVGGMGTFWMALMAVMSGGFAYLWCFGLVFRLAFAVVAGLVAALVARIGSKPPTAIPAPEKTEA
jgi:hypothetical protein